MNYDKFYSIIEKLRNLEAKMQGAREYLGQDNFVDNCLDITYNIIFDLLLPDAADEVYEDLGDLIFASKVTTKDIQDFYLANIL